MTKTAEDSRAEKLALYEKLIATHPDVKRKGDTMPYTSLNGHMFSLLTKDDRVALRLPKGSREEFLEKYGTKLCEQYGTVMKEYVDVPDALLQKTKELSKYFALSHDYVATLKPEAVRPKKAAKRRS